MSSRDQLSKKTSDYTNQGGADLTQTAAVWNVQITSLPASGNIFRVGPTAFRFTSATVAGWNTAGYFGMTRGANVSAAASAMSAAINLATNFDENYDYAVSCGATAATAAGSTTDITVTAAVAGNFVDVEEMAVSGFVATNTTAGRTGGSLPEGYLSFQTSAGNVINVKDPAEYTRALNMYPSKLV